MRELAPRLPEGSELSVHEPPSFVNEFQPEEDAIELRSYWRLLVKHRWLITSIFFCSIVATTIIVLSMTPIYTAETTLLIERKTPQAINMNNQETAEAEAPDEYDYYRTQYEILKSDGLVTQVVQEQQLDGLPLFAVDQEPEGIIGKLWARLTHVFTSPKGTIDGSSQNSAQGEETKPSLSPDLIETYTKMLTIKPVPRTRLVKVAFSTPDPVLSARIANGHAQVYIRQGVGRRNQADEASQGFLEEKLVELRERLEKSEAALNRYSRDQGIITLNDPKDDDEKGEDLATRHLETIDSSLAEAEAERIALEAQMTLIRKKDYEVLPDVVNNPLIQTLKEQLGTLEANRAQLLSEFKESYPQIVELKAQIARTESQLRQEIERVAQSIQSSYQFAVDKERELRNTVEEQKKEVMRLKDAAVKYAILAREVDTNRQLYDNVLQRMKEVGVAAELRDSNISVIDEAEPPLRPSSPRKLLSLLLSAIGGLLGGVGTAFFLEYLDNRLHTPEEVERYIRLPSLAVIPDFARTSEHQAYAPYAPKPLLNGHGAAALNGDGSSTEKGLANSANGKATGTSELVLDHHTFSLFSESYKTLRAALLLSRAEAAPKTLLFTSATAGEGKTATATNTAIVFSQLGLRVLLIDADLRRARCHKMLGVQKGIGLTEFLTGRREMSQVIRQTAVENLFFLSSGVAPPNPAELMSSRKMQETLQIMREKYDCVIIDSPPVMPVSDARLLSTMVDGVVLVVNGQTTPREIVRGTRARLEQVGAKILGVVLNRVDVHRSGYGYYYYGYGYYSGYSGYYTTKDEEEEAQFEENEMNNKT